MLSKRDSGRESISSFAIPILQGLFKTKGPTVVEDPIDSSPILDLVEMKDPATRGVPGFNDVPRDSVNLYATSPSG
jgi:hypothetical protein